MRARLDRGRRREESTRRGRPRCRPRTEAARPSFRTSERPEPTSPHSRRNPTLEESGHKNKKKIKTFSKYYSYKKDRQLFEICDTLLSLTIVI